MTNELVIEKNVVVNKNTILVKLGGDWGWLIKNGEIRWKKWSGYNWLV